MSKNSRSSAGSSRPVHDSSSATRARVASVGAVGAPVKSRMVRSEDTRALRYDPARSAGVLIDRVKRRRLLMMNNGWLCTISLAIGLLLVTGHEQIIFIFISRSFM